MRTLTRWKQQIKYKCFTGYTEIIDDDGYRTGETTASYGAVKTGYVNVSPGTGKANASAFGLDVPYDKVLCTTEDLGLTEQSMIWIDHLDSDNPDYIVRRIARSVLGIYSIAVSRIV